MSIAIKLTDSPKKLSAAAGDVLVTGSAYLIAFTGTTKPTANYSGWHYIDKTAVWPKGTVAWLKEVEGYETSVVASVLGESGASPTDPWA